ncbi:MAG TPA: zinc ribbon domain-containing protein [Thermoanaerobaculia bacterium]|nr:zinc ribbon domain-containing protein [Thermoanaerobaculia bacterium]
MTDKKECVACRHEIDAAARICPYCGADPGSGRRFDPAPILQSHFPMKDPAPRARVLEFLRERQGLVVSAIVVILFLLIGAAHQMITRRNLALESSAPAVPLTDLADLNQAGQDQKELPIPELQFAWTGNPETMDVFLIEPGAVAPPPSPEATTTTAGPATTPPQRAPAAAAQGPRRTPPPGPARPPA